MDESACRAVDRGDTELLSSALGSSQAPEVDQHARALERGDQASDARGADLPERSKLPAAGPSLGYGDTRELDRGHPLPEHGSATRTPQAASTQGGHGRVGRRSMGGPALHGPLKDQQP